MSSPMASVCDFLGILVNVTSNITKVHLEYDFNIIRMSREELQAFLLTIQELNNGQYATAYDMLYTFFRDNDSKEFIIITNSMHINKIDEFDEDCVREYLLKVLSYMRLFKEGNPELIWYCYHTSSGLDDEGGALGHTDYIKAYDETVFDILDDEVDAFQQFLLDVATPYPLGYLQIAYETFQESYERNNTNLAFLLNMIGLEALLNPGGTELTYRVSRNASILLGEDREKSLEVFNSMKRLYKVRSNLVHGNKKITIDNSDLLLLRKYLRESIKQISRINEKKQELLSDLNLYGFGERPWV